MCRTAPALATFLVALMGCGDSPTEPEVITVTKTVVVTDTLVVTDTIIVTETDTVYVTVTDTLLIVNTDTIYIANDVGDFHFVEDTVVVERSVRPTAERAFYAPAGWHAQEQVHDYVGTFRVTWSTGVTEGAFVVAWEAEGYGERCAFDSSRFCGNVELRFADYGVAHGRFYALAREDGEDGTIQRYRLVGYDSVTVIVRPLSGVAGK